MSVADYLKSDIDVALASKSLEIYQEYLTDLKRSGKGYMARCRFHDDRTASLSVDVEKGLWKCFGCDKSGDTYELVGLAENVGFPETLNILGRRLGIPAAIPVASRHVVATYDYVDEQGHLLHQVVRREPKSFFQRRPDGEGDWINDMKGVRRVLYQLPDVRDAVANGRVVHVVEGEKDVLTMRELGLPATCNVGGAGKWDSSYTETLRGACVVILGDNDDAGRSHTQAVAASLHGVAEWVRVVELPGLPPKGDVTDWFGAGGTKEELIHLVRETPPWTPPAAPDASAQVSVHATPKLGYPAPPNEAAFYGLAGDVVRTIAPHTEADPVALLIQFLVAFGSVIGRVAHFMAESDAHYGNLFAVLVGQSSKARKGTSWGYIRRLFSTVASEWVEQKIVSGLSSGEGLIHAVRDPVEKEGKDEDGQPATIVVDPGVEDKRLLAQEAEFASLLRVATRDGNTVSATLRNFWDTGRAQTLTKKEPARATGAHVSVVGHITRDELRLELNSTEAANGFANRFLWFFVRRSKELPEGGKLEEGVLSDLTYQLKKTIETASKITLVKRDPQARRLWCEVYHDLSAARPGLVGAVTSRAEAQVMRLAMLYALLDCSDEIRPEHLMAALALWEYSVDSARHIFGESLGDPVADAILDRLRDKPDGLTRTDIRDLFQKNQTSERVGQALALLNEYGRARCEMVKTGGKPAERWFAVTAGGETAPPS